MERHRWSAARWRYRGLLHAPLLSALASSGAKALEGKKNGLAWTGFYIQETRLLMLRRLTLTTRNGALPTGGSQAWASWPLVVNSARTAAAAVVSLLVARLFRLPEAYWAPITTLVIMQSTLGAALPISAQRLAGTAVG